jgi:hypothetical protein
MRTTAISRRAVFRAGACAAAAAVVPQWARAGAKTSNTELRSKSQDAVRNYYAAWETKSWHPVDILLADNFTFSSPLDDHINKSAFKAGCWDTQIAYIERFELQQVMGTDDEAFVIYVCHTTNGKTFRNVEYFQFSEDKVKAVECYFGGKSSFPSAASAGKG